MTIVRFLNGIYAWTGEGTPEDSIWVKKGTMAMIIASFMWRKSPIDPMPAHFFLLDDGRIGWTPIFSTKDWEFI